MAVITHVFAIRYLFRILAVLFQYLEQHQYPIRGQILKPTVRVEASPFLSRNVMQTIRLATKNCGTSLASK